MSRQTLFDRLMAVNPADANLSTFPVLNEDVDKKVGEVNDFHRRLIVIRDVSSDEHDRALNELRDAIEAHNEYHDQNPETKHGGPLCKAAHAAIDKVEAIEKEGHLLVDILRAALRIDFPEGLGEGSSMGIRRDGSVIVKSSLKSDSSGFMQMLADALGADLVRETVGAGRG